MANEYKKVITLNLDYSQMSNSVTEIDRKMKLLDAEFKMNKESMKSTADAGTLLELEIQRLNERITLQTQKVKLEKEALDNAKKSTELTAKEKDRLAEKYLKSETYLAKLNNTLNDSEKELKELTEASKKAGEGLDKATSSSVDFASKLYIAQEALQAVKTALTDFISFDQSMAKVNSIADTTVVSFKDLKQGVYDIAKETGLAANTISDALYQTISSNVATQDSLSVTLQAAKLAKAGFTDTSTAVDILTTIMNSYGMSVNEVVAISDKLILTQNLGKTTVGELASSFGNVAGLAKQANISLDEVLAATATLTQTNGSASESLTSLKAAISNIIKPTAEARETAKSLRLQFDSTALATNGLSGFLEKVKKATGGNVETMAKLFGSTEALNSILLLTGTGADSFTDSLIKISGASGNTDEAINDINSTGGRFTKSLQNMQTTLIQLGDVLSPVLDALAFLFDVLSNIPAPIYAVIGVISGLLLIMKNWSAITKTISILHSGLTIIIGGLTSILGIKAAAQSASTAADVAATGAAAGAAAANTALGASGAVATAGLAPLLLLILAIVVGIGLLKGAIKSIPKFFSEAKSSANDLLSTSDSVTASIQSATNKSKIMGSNARGTRFFPGGQTVVGEDGPEVVTFPRGSTISSNRDSQRMFGGNTYYVTNVIEPRQIRDIQYITDLTRNSQLSKRRGVRGIV